MTLPDYDTTDPFPDWFMTGEAAPGVCAWNDHVFGKDLRHVLTPGTHTCTRCGMKVTVV